jgi:hypothetical protein
MAAPQHLQDARHSNQATTGSGAHLGKASGEALVPPAGLARTPKLSLVAEPLQQQSRLGCDHHLSGGGALYYFCLAALGACRKEAADSAADSAVPDYSTSSLDAACRHP